MGFKGTWEKGWVVGVGQCEGNGTLSGEEK